VEPAESRLREVPWRALEGLGPALDRPLGEVLAGAAAERVLDRFLRSRRDLGREARAAAAESVFGVGLWRRRLRWQAGAGGPPRLLLAALLRDLGAEPGAEAILGLPRASLPPPRPPPPTLADRWSLPGWLAEILAREAGDEAGALAAALALPGPICLRANLLRTDREGLAVRLRDEGLPTRPGHLAPACLVALSPRPNLLALPALREGLLEVQDEASQLVAALAAARPGESILDACAGAGGKTLALAAEVGATGRVHAADPDLSRLARLGARARRAGAESVVAIHRGGAPPDLSVDRALVDAPCSELGALRRGPDLRWRMDPASFAALPALQRSILAGAAARVRPGGRLVYATCTFRREENEDVALAFERDHPAFRRLRPEAPGEAVTAEGFLRTWPHRHGTDGFFAAVWERAGSGRRER
jgi:16S rRNA (cytosine967-C5)-methyltransferase